jgi:cell division topological specificity factor
MNLLERLRIGQRGSAHTAKERLRLVLTHDRSGLSPGVLEVLKDDIIDVLSRHVEIDKRSVRISLTRDGNQQRLVADIPLAPQRSRRRRNR